MESKSFPVNPVQYCNYVPAYRENEDFSAFGIPPHLNSHHLLVKKDSLSCWKVVAIVGVTLLVLANIGLLLYIHHVHSTVLRDLWMSNHNGWRNHQELGHWVDYNSDLRDHQELSTERNPEYGMFSHSDSHNFRELNAESESECSPDPVTNNDYEPSEIESNSQSFPSFSSILFQSSSRRIIPQMSETEEYDSNNVHDNAESSRDASQFDKFGRYPLFPNMPGSENWNQFQYTPNSHDDHPSDDNFFRQDGDSSKDIQNAESPMPKIFSRIMTVELRKLLHTADTDGSDEVDVDGDKHNLDSSMGLFPITSVRILRIRPSFSLSEDETGNSEVNDEDSEPHVEESTADPSNGVLIMSRPIVNKAESQKIEVASGDLSSEVSIIPGPVVSMAEPDKMEISKDAENL